MSGAEIDLDQAKLDPGSVFKTPRDVLTASGLSFDDRKAILMRWEADADALLRATDEGMSSGERSAAELLRAIQAALQQLDEHH